MKRLFAVCTTLTLFAGIICTIAEDLPDRESALQKLFLMADIVVTGNVVSRTHVSINHGGKSRTPVDLHIREVIKGSVTNDHIRILVVTNYGSTKNSIMTNGSPYVFFLNSSLQTCEPFQSVQTEDEGLVGALKSFAKKAK